MICLTAPPSPKCFPDFTFTHVNINHQLHNTKPSRQPPEPFRMKSSFHTPPKHSILLSLSHLNINQHHHTIPDSTHVTHPPNPSLPISLLPLHIRQHQPSPQPSRQPISSATFIQVITIISLHMTTSNDNFHHTTSSRQPQFRNQN